MGMNGKITLVSNKGTGSTRVVQIAKGMTAQEALYGELGIQNPKNLSVVVNGEPVPEPSKCVLKDGDFVIIVPSNMKGAKEV